MHTWNPKLGTSYRAYILLCIQQNSLFFATTAKTVRQKHFYFVYSINRPIYLWVSLNFIVMIFTHEDDSFWFLSLCV